jgi:hypothetical protein
MSGYYNTKGALIKASKKDILLVMQDIEFIDEHPEDSDLFRIDRKPAERPRWVVSFLINKKMAVNEDGAFKILLSASIILLVLSALIFIYYAYGVDQFKSVPHLPTGPSASPSVSSSSGLNSNR